MLQIEDSENVLGYTDTLFSFLFYVFAAVYT